MDRETTDGEFVAESLEAEAKKTTSTEIADAFLQAAKWYREQGPKRRIIVSDSPRKDFIKPDPTSHK
jgi:hypothetical protein